MSNRVETAVTATGEFHARFGSSPAIQDDKAACAQWESLCTALLKELEQLRADLKSTQVERDAYKSLYFHTEPEISYTREEVLAQMGKNPPIRDLIAQIEREAEARHDARSTGSLQG